MKTPVVAIALGLCIGLAARGGLSAQSPTLPAPATDQVVLQNGAAVPCRIVQATGDALRIEYRPPGGVGLMTRDVSWTEIRSAEFAMDQEFHTLLRTTDAARDGVRLAARWQALLPLLGRPHHPAGDLGLAYAGACLNSPAEATRTRTLEICDAIIAGDWSLPRRNTARWLKIQALVALNRKPEALAAARQALADEHTDDTLAVRALLFVGRQCFEELRQLQVENPRWQEDDLLLPERQRLFHEAVESFLKPSLFYSAQEDAASEGLWQAGEVLLFDGDAEGAAHCARDILHLHPKAREAEAARQLLTRLKLPLEVPATAPDLATETPKMTEPPAATAPKEPETARRKRHAKPDGQAPGTIPSP